MIEEYRSLHQVLESSLRRDIIDGVFPPGTHLLERTLVERYGVSRGPIREVLRALEVQGLLVRTRSKGVNVAELSLDEMSEVYEMRIALEGLAARLAVEAADREGIEQVRLVYDRLQAAQCEQRHWLELSNEFRCALYQLSGRKRLLALIRQLVGRVEPYISLYLEDSEHRMQSRAKHQEIWRAVLEHDADRCERLTQQHLTTAGDSMERMLKRLSPKDSTDPDTFR